MDLIFLALFAAIGAPTITIFVVGPAVNKAQQELLLEEHNERLRTDPAAIGITEPNPFTNGAVSSKQVADALLSSWDEQVEKECRDAGISVDEYYEYRGVDESRYDMSPAQVAFAMRDLATSTPRQLEILTPPAVEVVGSTGGVGGGPTSWGGGGVSPEPLSQVYQPASNSVIRMDDRKELKQRFSQHAPSFTNEETGKEGACYYFVKWAHSEGCSKNLIAEMLGISKGTQGWNWLGEVLSKEGISA